MPGSVSEVSATLVASTTRRPCVGRSARALGRRLAAVQRQQRDAARRGEPRELALGGLDLALAGEEHQRVAVIVGEAGERSLQTRDQVPRRGRVRGRLVLDSDRPGPAHGFDKCAFEAGGELWSLDGGRGEHEPRRCCARAEQAERKVDLEAALVELIEQHAAKRKHGGGEQAQRDARGDKEDAR